MTILSLFSIPHVPYAYIYPKPINMTFGEKKLIAICIDEMGLDPNEGALFLFFNKSQNRLKLFFLDSFGSQELVKVLPKGGFMLPVAVSGEEKYIKIDTKKLNSLFRS